MFDALVATLSDTRLEPDLHALLWSLVNVFHRRIDRIERDLDDNERAQRSGQREQDGSEVRSVELERLVAQGLTLIERRNSFEFLRDAAAELYGVHTGQAWRPTSPTRPRRWASRFSTAARRAARKRSSRGPPRPGTRRKTPLALQAIPARHQTVCRPTHLGDGQPAPQVDGRSASYTHHTVTPGQWTAA
jgi:hypothetical protein